jgi:hypothetical protein
MKRILSLTIFIELFIFLSLLNATTYYVSVTGDNDDSGSIDAPFRTIKKAIDTSIYGDEIIVFEGVYGYSVTVR